MNALPVALATAPLQLALNRTGGAVIHARLSIWSDVGTSTEKKVLVLFFEDSSGANAPLQPTIAAGTYSCVLTVFIREDLHGLYTYEHLVNGQLMAADSGDVNTTPSPGDGIINRHEYVLVAS